MANDASRAASAHLAASLFVPMTAPVTDPDAAAGPARTDEFTAVRHVYEPHAIGLPPLRPYIRELWRRREFAQEMARTTLRALHFDTVMGQLWLVLNPVLLACVYFLLVDIIGARSGGITFFAHLMACLFVFHFVTDAMRQAVKSVTGGGRLILNTAFPRVLLPASSVIVAFKRFLPTIVIFIPAAFAASLPFGPELLWLLPVFGLFLVLASGLAMWVAAGQVYFRDLKNFLQYALRMWLYASPILYYASSVPERYDFLLYANPMSPLLTMWSDIIEQGVAPAGADLALAAGWAFALFFTGALFFISREREFAVRL